VTAGERNAAQARAARAEAALAMLLQAHIKQKGEKI
jgi:hypothetical protein